MSEPAESPTRAQGTQADDASCADKTHTGATTRLADNQDGQNGQDTDAAPTARLADAQGEKNTNPEATERRAPVEAAPPEADEPALRDIMGALGRYRRGRTRALGKLVGRRRGVLLALLALVIVGTVTVAATLGSAPGLPSAEQVREDLAALPAPAYAGGDFGSEEPLTAHGVEVREVARGSEAGQATARALVSYEGTGVVADASITAPYVLEDGTWTLDTDGLASQVSWRATAGVDPNRVVAGLPGLLARADEELGRQEDAGPTLSGLYAGAQVSVGPVTFDERAQTSSLELTCREGTGRVVRECRLTVSFAFRQANGQWEVEGVEVADGAFDLRLDDLLGAWSGTFASQSTEGSKCLAARESGLSVQVDASSPQGGGTLTGTVSGVAHYHAHPADDAASCEGDQALADVPFTARLVEADEKNGTLVFEATLPEDVGGTCSLRLYFGSAGDPSTVVAELTTTYPHTGSFLFIPFDETLTYTDRFTLVQG